ncbi:MAG: cytochrome bc complex cytochrome b subunit [Myxococcota bacterium]|jgi:cytochrome b6|nr:cytochrome bc complex cytochrome b subunit [Myxococcota bacterium]
MAKKQAEIPDFAPIPEELEAHLGEPSTVTGKAARALLHRYPVWPVLKFFAHKRVPQYRHSYWYMMGGMLLFFFGIQVVTGILLMVYYQPGSPWASVNYIVNEVPYGALIRSIHHWSANLMVLTVFLHLFSTFFMKAYRRPRELTWITGLGLAGLTMLFGFSGYLLPWDELAFFAVRIGISELEKLPLLGEWAAGIARGGSDVSQETIGRFYALHVMVLPLSVMGLIGLHLLLVQIQGVSEPDGFRKLPASQRKYRNFFSDFLIAEIPVWLMMGALLVLLSALMPRELGTEADVFAAAPDGIKPEWYLLAPYQGLKLFPGSLELLGMLVMGLVPMALVVVPFIDRQIPADARGRLVTKIGVLGLIGFVLITAWGFFS